MIRAEPERVFIEHCINCFQHTWCTNHDENKYKDCFVKCKECILRVCDNVSVCENVVPVGLENEFIVTPSISRPGKVHFPRIGSFEIYFRGKCIFSKLNSMKWPPPSQIAEKLKQIQEAPQKSHKKKPEIRTRSSKPVRKIIKNNPIKVQKKKESQEFVYEKIESLIKERQKRVKRFSDLFEKEKNSGSSSGDAELEGFTSIAPQKKETVVEKSQERLQKKELKEFFGEIKIEGQRLADEAKGRVEKIDVEVGEKVQNGQSSLFSSSNRNSTSSEDEVIELENRGFKGKIGLDLEKISDKEVEVKGKKLGENDEDEKVGRNAGGEKLDIESDKEKKELLGYEEDYYSSESEKSERNEENGSKKDLEAGGIEVKARKNLDINGDEDEYRDKSSESDENLGKDGRESSSNLEDDYKDDYESKDSKESSGKQKQGSDKYSEREKNTSSKKDYSKSNSENEENYGNDFSEKDSKKSEKSENYSEPSNKDNEKSEKYSEHSDNYSEKSYKDSENPNKNSEKYSEHSDKDSEKSDKDSENPNKDSEKSEKYSEHSDKDSEKSDKDSEKSEEYSKDNEPENYSEDNEDDEYGQNLEENELFHPLKPISKSFQITLKVGVESRKKITYENISEKSASFVVKSSNSSLMSIKDEELQIDEGVKEKIQLIFAPFSSECEKKFYIYIDKDGEHWECIEIVANYTN